LGQEKNGLPLPSSGEVTLQLGEYNRLLELASKPVKKTDMPPLPYAIKAGGVEAAGGQ